MKYYLFRHGATRASVTDNIYLENEIVTAEILDSGIPAVRKIAGFLKTENIDKYYTSPYIRCVQTMDIISEITKKKYIRDERLGEFREDEGELFENFAKRIRSFIDHTTNNLQPTTKMAICTHGAGLSGLKHWLIYGKYERENLMDFPVPGVLWIIENKELKVVDFTLR